MGTEADTCRKYILKKIYAAGWEDDLIFEQKTFTDGRIIIVGDKRKRSGKTKRADYILKYSKDFPIAVVEAKSEYKEAADGLQQAMEYAEILDLKFAYASNGLEIIEHDYTTGKEKMIDGFPSPDELWERLKNYEGLKESVKKILLYPSYNLPGIQLRYYQELAINLAVKNILNGKKRILLTLATGTGKTLIAFHIIWKLWNNQWNLKGDYRKPKILYLADRTFLIDRPKDTIFAVFGDARHKISKEAIFSRELYFSTYQAIACDERRPGLFKQYKRDFFDLIIIDECHRGSASDKSTWREILEYFGTSVQIGMTATPKRDDNIDTYNYFGNPVYTYSLKQGIRDGFLAPFKVHRVITSRDKDGWRPKPDQKDKHGRKIPNKKYTTKDFERIVSDDPRSYAVAKHLTEFMKQIGRFAKTIVFCVDQEHASRMRFFLNNLNSDFVRAFPNYIVRIVSEEGTIGRKHLDDFMDIENKTPTIVTTSKLLTTGVDVPTCENIVIFRVVNSITEFKQIIGRGTRIRDDYEKLYFNIIDYTGYATKMFEDPEFDGEPVLLTQEELDEKGDPVRDSYKILKKEEIDEEDIKIISTIGKLQPDKKRDLKKYYIDKGTVEIVEDTVYNIDEKGKRSEPRSYIEYVISTIKELFKTASELKSSWKISKTRAEIIEKLKTRGIIFEDLLEVTSQPNADPFDLLCHIAYNAPIRTRQERAKLVLDMNPEFFNGFNDWSREILMVILEKYIEFGYSQLDNLNILTIPEIKKFGNILEISKKFGGTAKLKEALRKLQNLIYCI